MIEKLHALRSSYDEQGDEVPKPIDIALKINEIIDVVNNLKPKLGFPVVGVTQSDQNRMEELENFAQNARDTAEFMQESAAEFEKKRRLEEVARLRNEFLHPDPLEPHLKDK